MASESQPATVTIPHQGGEAKRFWLVASNLLIKFDLPAEVIPHHELRRPSAEELSRIRDFLSQSPFPERQRVYYECGWVRDENGPGERSVELPPERWRYYVVEPPQQGERQADGTRVLDCHEHLIERAARLCDVELSFAATLYPGGGVHYDGSGPLIRGSFGPAFHPITFEQSHLTAIRQIYDQLNRVGPAFPDIVRAVDMYFALRRVEHRELYALGAFAIIESLLTHNPTGGYDSLTHQISAKFPLLNRRMPTPVERSAFGNTPESKFWKKLYQYRSTIAHGSKTDFHSELKILRSAVLVEEFLDRALKALMRFALEEPELVTDLRRV